MPGITKRRVFRILLTAFRWLRISLWLVVLILLSAFLYLHVADMPQCVKTPLLNALRQRGINAQFSKMRLGWSQEVLLKNVSFGPADETNGPSLSVGAAEIRLNLPALLHGEFKIKSFTVSDGRLQIPLSESAGDTLALENVEFAFRFLPNDCVELENARGNIRALSIRLHGSLTNFSAIQNWSPSNSTAAHAKPEDRTATRRHWQTTLRQITSIADKFQFTSPPELTGRVSGDVSNPDTLFAQLRFTALGATTPWGEMADFKLDANCSHIVSPGSTPFARLTLSAKNIKTDWGGGNQVTLGMTLSRTEQDLNLVNGKTDLTITQLLVTSHPVNDTNWVRAANLHWDGSILFTVTNFAVHSAEGKLKAREIVTSWGQIGQAEISFRSITNQNISSLNLPIQYWPLIQNRKLNWQVRAENIKTPDLNIQSATCSGHWDCPSLVLENLETRLCDGKLKLDGQYNLANKKLTTHLYSDIDPRGLASLLPPPARHWLDQVQYTNPPILQFQAQAILPEWSTNKTSWIEKTLPTLCLNGSLKVGPLTSHGFQLNSGIAPLLFTNQTLTVNHLQITSPDGNLSVARADFSLPNLALTLKNLHVSRPEGEIFLNINTDIPTHQFSTTIDSHVNPKELLEHFANSPDMKPWLDSVKLDHPPKIHVEATGDWRSIDQTVVKATLELTNFAAFNQPYDSLTTAFTYSNLLLQITNLQLRQNTQHVLIPQASFNFTNNRLTLSNAFSTYNPRDLFKSLGPILPPFLLVISFDQPPTIRVNGYFSVIDDHDVDLHFKISGTNFRWTKCQVDSVRGDVDWVGSDVSLTNVVASLYGGGTATGWAYFDCRIRGTAVHFSANANNVDLNTLARGLSRRPSTMEGKLHVFVDTYGRANSRLSWKGHGDANLKDGLIWDIPMFGAIISKLLNGISTGVANNRAREAAGTFIVTNGVLYSDDLKIQASMVRLLYKGTADENTIDALVEAQVLRNTPLLGPIISTITAPIAKVLIYRVSGPLEDPTVKAEYFPGTMLEIISHPFRSLKSILPGTSPSGNTNNVSNNEPLSLNFHSENMRQIDNDCRFTPHAQACSEKRGNRGVRCQDLAQIPAQIKSSRDFVFRVKAMERAKTFLLSSHEMGNSFGPRTSCATHEVIPRA